MQLHPAENAYGDSCQPASTCLTMVSLHSPPLLFCIHMSVLIFWCSLSTCASLLLFCTFKTHFFVLVRACFMFSACTTYTCTLMAVTVIDTSLPTSSFFFCTYAWMLVFVGCISTASPSSAFFFLEPLFLVPSALGSTIILYWPLLSCYRSQTRQAFHPSLL